jgi:hypothetical protein
MEMIKTKIRTKLAAIMVFVVAIPIIIEVSIIRNLYLLKNLFFSKQYIWL